MRLLKILLQNWGPHERLEMELSPALTVIYGQNEKGKTALLEAIIMALCPEWTKVYPRMRTREEFVGSAVVGLEIGGKQIRMDFPSRSRRRRKSEGALRASLLFSWPGEAERPGLVSEMLAGLLLPWEVLSWNPLQGLGADGIIDGRVKGSRRGRYKELMELIDELRKLKRAEEAFYSTSEVRLLDLERQLEIAKSQWQEVLKAKRLLAGKIFQELKELEQELSSIPKENLSQISQVLGRIEKINAIIASHARSTPEVSEQDLIWWETLVRELENLPKSRVSPGIYYGMILLLVLGLILVVFSPWLWLRLMGAILISLAIVGVVISRERRRTEDKIREILFRAGEKAGEEFVSVEQIKGYLDLLRRKFSHHQARQEEIAHLQAELAREKVFLAQIGAGEDPRKYLSEMHRKIKELETHRQLLQERLNQLGVARDEMIFDEELSCEYDVEKEKSLSRRIEELSAAVEEERRRTEALRAGIISLLGLKGDENLKQVFVAIKNREKELEKQIRQITCQIVAGIAWRKVLDRLKSEQFKQVSDLVNHPDFLHYLSVFTNQAYGNVSLRVEEDDLFLIRNGEEYRFSLLSSGAKHQVLFALKCALLKRIYNEPGFVVLDDVFIFSDDERLKRQLMALKALAEEGWQVIYLTSDDTTRKMFKELGVDAIWL